MGYKDPEGRKEIIARKLKPNLKERSSKNAILISR